MQEDIYELYLEELKGIKPCTREEERVLLRAVLEGDKNAKKRLIEGKLKQALLTAKQHEERGLPLGDLIQEANMALMLLVDAYEGGDFDQLLEKQINQKIELALEEQKNARRTEEELTARVNVLTQVSQMMAEELGREATVGELALRMKMTEEEIKSIMKISLDAVSTAI